MNRFNVIVISILLSGVTLCAQEKNSLFDDKVTEICSWIDALKQNSEGYKEVCSDMADNMYWRLMEEYYDNCTDVTVMCSLWDDVDKTGINDTAFQAEKNRGTKPQSTDNFCSGNETKYHYSLYECSLFPGKCVSTVLGQRKGGQLFLIIPYNPGVISAKVFLNDRPIEMSDNPSWEGCPEFYFDAEESDQIRIEVSNVSSSNQSFVLVNHNSIQ